MARVWIVILLLLGPIAGHACAGGESCAWNFRCDETAGARHHSEDSHATVVLPMRFPTYDKMRGGEWIVAVEAHEHAYYTGLQVTRDPGIFLVYIGFGLLIGGCFVTFFLGHERVAVQVSRISTTCTVRVHGARHRPSIGFKNRLEKITANLKDSKKERI